MRISTRCFNLAILLLLTASLLPAQSSSAVSGQSQPDILSLDVVVTGHKGLPVAGLTKSDFTVLDNGIPQKITSFQPMTGKASPVEVIIIVDDVNTGYFKLPYERQEMEKFFQANGGKLPYPTSLEIFTDAKSKILQNYTQDGALLSAALAHHPISQRPIRRSGGAAGDADRYVLSLKMLNQVIQSEGMASGRKIMLWVSPGWPLLNGPGNSLSKSNQQVMFNDLEGFTSNLRKNQITLYALNPDGLSDKDDFDFDQFLKPVRKFRRIQYGNLSLQALTLHSGGLILGWSNNISGLMQKVMNDMQNFYQLTYTAPASQPDVYHAIQIKIAKPRLKARTTTGYYSGY
ncbi:MAG TPA: VWA domain-containing protein [Acidobacteriaceae bacterium]|nr:VWA domain-containing protein [Acidobacteriaceae bacterium]